MTKLDRWNWPTNSHSHIKLHPLQYLVEPLPCLLNRSIRKKTPVLSILSLTLGSAIFVGIQNIHVSEVLQKKLFVKVVVRKDIFKKFVSLLLQSLSSCWTTTLFDCNNWNQGTEKCSDQSSSEREDPNGSC